MQFQLMDQGPKLIAGDLNGPTEAFPSLQAMLRDQGWFDVGAAEDKCGGEPGQPTCHTNEGARETKISYLIANAVLMPAIERCGVDQTSSFPTHRPLSIEVNIDKVVKMANKLQRPTNSAGMFEGRVQKEHQQYQQDKQAREAELGADAEEGAKCTDKDENFFRKELKKELHTLMDEQIQNRQHRFKQAILSKDTNRIWQLIAAAVEQANIAFNHLRGKDATKMQGRSKITRKKREKDILQGIDAEHIDDELATKADWLRNIAGEHMAQGNRLTNVARRMKVGADNRTDVTKKMANCRHCAATFKAYIVRATTLSKNKELTEAQRNQSTAALKDSIRRKRKTKGDATTDTQATDTEKHLEHVQQHAIEMHEMLQDIQDVNLQNVIHAAKVRRMADLHDAKAKVIRDHLKAEIQKVRRYANACKKSGIRSLSKAVGEQRVNALTCTVKDKDTNDGGKKGQITTNLADIDGIVKRAWKTIYDGVGGNIGTAVHDFLNKYSRYILKTTPFDVPLITGQRVYETFYKTTKSAGALDG